MNTRFEYFYRDGANYKSPGYVILTGMPSFTNAAGEFICGMDGYERELRKVLHDNSEFIATQIGVPEVFLYTDKYTVDEDDTCWHEFTGIWGVEEPPTTKLTPEEFLGVCRRASEEGWRGFDPEDHPRARIRRCEGASSNPALDLKDLNGSVGSYLTFKSSLCQNINPGLITPELWKAAGEPATHGENQILPFVRRLREELRPQPQKP